MHLYSDGSSSSAGKLLLATVINLQRKAMVPSTRPEIGQNRNPKLCNWMLCERKHYICLLAPIGSDHKLQAAYWYLSINMMESISSAWACLANIVFYTVCQLACLVCFMLIRWWDLSFVDLTLQILYPPIRLYVTFWHSTLPIQLRLHGKC